MVYIYITDGCTGLAVGAHVGEIVVGTKGLSRCCSADTASDVKLLVDDVVPNGVDSIDVGRVACEGSYIGHTGIHISSTYGVTYGLVLLYHGLVAL